MVYFIGLLVYLHDLTGFTTNNMYHVESPVDEPSWVTAAVGSLANLEVLSYDILEVKGMYLLTMTWMNKVSKKRLNIKL